MSTPRDVVVAAHEEGFVNAFIEKGYRDRLRFELERRNVPTRRIKQHGQFLGRFNHGALKYLDHRFVITLKPPNSDPSEIKRLLDIKGAASTCYAISSADSIDGCILPLANALEVAVGFGMPTILSCVPGRLAYLETEQVVGPRTASSSSGLRSEPKAHLGRQLDHAILSPQSTP